MKIYNEIDLKDFDAWAEATHTLDVLSKNGDCEIVETYILDCFESEYITDTAVNDILRFEQDEIAHWLGYESWDAYEKSTNDDEED